MQPRDVNTLKRKFHSKQKLNKNVGEKCTNQVLIPKMHGLCIKNHQTCKKTINCHLKI